MAFSPKLLSPAGRNQALAALNRAAVSSQAWKSYRSAMSEAVLETILDAAMISAADERATLLKAIRRVHHTLYVASRLRRDAVRQRADVPSDLLGQAEQLFDPATAPVRSKSDQKAISTARVHWHLLLKRFGVVTARTTNIARELRAAAGRPFDVSEVPAIVEKRTRARLSELLAFVETTAASYPTAANSLEELEQALRAALEVARPGVE